MRRIIAILIGSVALCLYSQGSSAKADIVLATGAATEFPDADSAARGLERKGQSFVCRQLTLDNKVLSNPALLSERLQAYVSGVRAKAVILNPAAVGTARAFNKLRDANPGIILIAIAPEDPSLDIEAASDLVLDVDWVGRAVLLARVSGQYGLKEILYSPDLPAKGSEGRRLFKDVLSAAAADMGLGFMEMPGTGDRLGFLRERLSSTSGKLLLWPGDNKDSTDFLIQIRDGAGYVLERPDPSGLIQYPALFGFDPAAAGGDYQKLLKSAERNAIEEGAAGRFGLWEIPGDWALTRAAAQMAFEAAAKPALLQDAAYIQGKIAREMDGVKFRLSPRIDPDTGVRSRNHYLFQEDLYVLGKGFIPAGKTEIPGKYYLIKRK
jgi:hypothetical protein